MGLTGRVRRGDVFLVALGSTRGREVRKTRPCVVVSPDELNQRLATHLVVPLTTGTHPYPFRVPMHFADRDGHALVDQLRSVDASRFVKRLGAISTPARGRLLQVLRMMFEE